VSHVPPSTSRTSRVRTFMLIESVMSTLVISVMLVAALSAVALVRTGEARTVERRRGLLLAQMLMAEIFQQAYLDPSAGPGSFGIEADEVLGNRSRFDDVDDYAHWDASPPQNKDGTVIPWASGYEQIVDVSCVDPNNLALASVTETYVKRIQVVTKYQGRRVAALTAYRTVSWFDPAQVQGAPR
jgi:hypothetical protein